jgi:hypothetical protein
MIYNLEISIKLELNSVSEKQLLKIQNILINNMHKNKKIDFKTLDKLFAISPRPYHTTSLSHVELNHDLTLKTVQVEIIG